MIVIYFIIGLFIGSFINMLIDRLPRDEQIVTGRSHCDKCKHVLAWNDLIPVLSWIHLRGKCRYCRTKVPFRNTFVEILTGVLFAGTFYMWNNSVVIDLSFGSIILNYAILYLELVVITCLIAIFFIDLKHQIIPDSLTVIASIAATTMHILRSYMMGQMSFMSPMNLILSALAGSGFFAFLIAITKGRGMGWGDVKYAAFMGLWLGFPRIVFSLYFAFLTGAFVSVILIINKRKKFGQTIAFGPFLVFSTILAQYGILDILWRYVYGNLL